MVFPFLAESVREARKAPITHAGTEIRTLHDRGTDALRIGLPVDWDLFHGSYFGWAVAAFAFAGGAVDLDELCEARQPIMQRIRDGRFVGRESIGSDLERRVRSRVADAFNKGVRSVLIALADSDVKNQLRVPFDCNECVAVAKVLIIFG